MSELLALSVAERLRIAQALWDSIAAAPDSVPITEEQREELDRRLESYRRDPGAGSLWSDVKKRIRRRK